MRERIAGARLAFSFWRRGVRLGIAARIARGADGAVVSGSAFQAALDRLASLNEWAGHVGGLSRRAQDNHAANVEDVARILVLAGEIGDPTLDIGGVRERYLNIRYRAMSPGKRRRLQYEQALRQLEARSRPTNPVRVPEPVVVADGIPAQEPMPVEVAA